MNIIRILSVVLITLSGALTSAEALAQAAARILFASGNVSITAANGTTRSAQRNGDLNSGDAITTGANSWAQLRFSDGALTSLQPDSNFRIDDYRYQGSADGSERGFFSLLKGAMRTVTGAIGRGNQRNNYRVETPTATIGIRGTKYLASLANGLTVSVGNGRVALMNDAGELVLGPGQTGFVRDRRTLPGVVIRKPTVSAPAAQEFNRFVAAEQRNSEGSSLALSEHGESSSGGPAFAAALLSSTGVTDQVHGAYFPGATSSDFQLVTSGTTLQSFQYFEFNGNLGTASAAQQGSAGGLSYGLWLSPGATVAAFNSALPHLPMTNPYMSYVFGSAGALATTGSVALVPIGGTTPINAAGTTGTFITPSPATFNINFTNDTYSFAHLQFAVGGATYTMGSGGNHTLYGESRISGSNALGSCTGSGCGATTGLTSNWAGLIVNGGNNVGLNYAIKDPLSSNKAVIGVQVFGVGAIVY